MCAYIATSVRDADVAPGREAKREREEELLEAMYGRDAGAE